MDSKGFPHIRLRRLRQNDTIRNMLAAPMPGRKNLCGRYL